MTKTEVKDNNSCTPTQCGNGGEAAEIKPKYDVTRTESAWDLEIKVPGAKRDGVSVDFDDGVLDIKAQRTDSVPETWRPLNYTGSKSDYRLRLEVSEAVDADQIKAALEDGILRLNLPLNEAVKPRSISVA